MLAADNGGFNTLIVILFFISAVLILGCIALGIILYFQKKREENAKRVNALRTVNIATLITTGVVIICTVLSVFRYVKIDEVPMSSEPEPSSSTASDTESEEKKPEIIPPVPTLTPSAVDATNPRNWGVSWQIIQNGGYVNGYTRPQSINFGYGHDYAKIEGITTFRGDNYRSGASFGLANVQNKTLTTRWERSIGSLDGWSGSGWTGQPLVVRWDDETKQIMNLYEDKKAKSGLVEIIYATLDGNIYFYDLEDGTYTRDPIYMGMSFKGAGTLDPRGYPLMYVGSGLYKGGKAPTMFVVSLIEGKVIYEQSGRDSFNPRSGGWCAFDSSPLVSGDTDTLIWPGESGILYTIKLNTNFDKAAGTISVSPENVVKARYSTGTGRTLGFESSAVAVGEYVYIGDNGGMMFCVNINTMQLVWAQNTRDDVNATPVFEWGKDGRGYLYTATSMEYGGGTSYIYKLDASTGEIIWERSFSGILYDKGVSGGILGSPLLGKAGSDLEGMIIYPIGKTNNSDIGTLVALNTATGETVWEKRMGAYTWSSPTAVYTENGKSYFILCSALTGVHLYDGKTGEVLSSVESVGTIEASPVVFENTVVIGTRSQRVLGIEIS